MNDLPPQLEITNAADRAHLNKPESYLNTVRELSQRIVRAQSPIRILDASKWDDEVRDAFFASAFRELPAVDREYYGRNRPLGFDPEEKKAELHEIERDISRQLGQLSPLGSIMRRTCREYQNVVRMLECRGTPSFSRISEELYGGPGDVFHAGDPTVAELGLLLESILTVLLKHSSMQPEPKTIPSAEAVDLLNTRISQVYPDSGIRVIISDGITADAAAGTDYVKLRGDAVFSTEEIDVLEVHEGWVHLGTTLNGMAQPYCTFLSKGPPSATITQEGLAVLSEVISLRSSPGRLFRLMGRVRAVTLASEGADFIEVFNYLREVGLDDEDAYQTAVRVFRGSTPTGGPFTKDITYLKGLVLTVNYIRLAVIKGKLDRIPLLFCGKVVLEDTRSLAGLLEEGLIVPPRFVPPNFSDIKGLAAWMSLSRFLNALTFDQLEADYANIL